MNEEGLGKYLCIVVEWVMAFLTLRNRTSSICTMKRTEFMFVKMYVEMKMKKERRERICVMLYSGT